MHEYENEKENEKDKKKKTVSFLKAVSNCKYFHYLKKKIGDIFFLWSKEFVTLSNSILEIIRNRKIYLRGQDLKNKDNEVTFTTRFEERNQKKNQSAKRIELVMASMKKIKK